MKARERFDLSNAKVLSALATYKSVWKTAINLNCSEDLVRRVVIGDRKDPKPKKDKETPKKVCVSCNYRPVWEDGGCEKLCRLCYEYKGRGITIYG